MLAWGGFANGHIPLSQMIVVRQEPFEPIAAQQIMLLGAAFLARFGKPLIISDGYRSYAEQQFAYDAWIRYLSGGPYAPGANRPGTSNHGWGKAADFASGVQHFGTAEHNWLRDNGPAYGWRWGEAPKEAWHFTYYGNPTITPAGGGLEIIEEEDEMKAIYFIASDNTGLSVGVGKEDVWARSGPGEPLRRMTQGQWSEFQNARTPLFADVDYFWKPGAWFGLAFIEDNIAHGYNVGAHPWLSTTATANVDIDALVTALEDNAELTQIRDDLIAVRSRLETLPDAVRQNIKNAL